MHRFPALLALFICSLSLAGCGKSNDTIAKEVVAAFDGITSAVESGDKGKIQASIAQLTAVINENKDKKMDNEAKYKPQIEAAGKRMQAALMKAVSSGKMTQQEVMNIAQTMMNMKQ